MGPAPGPGPAVGPAVGAVVLELQNAQAARQSGRRRQASGPMLALNRLGEGGFDAEGERIDEAPPAYSSPTRNRTSTADETPDGTSKQSGTAAVDGRKVGQRL